MSGLIPLVKFGAINSDGTPLSGGQLFVYAAGTTNKVSLYSNNTLSTTITNPVVLNSRGETTSDGSTACAIWMADGTYKFVLATSTDTDPPATPIWTVDNVRIANNTIYDSNNNLIIALSATTGAVNYITIKNNSTGLYPEINATGESSIGETFRDSNGNTLLKLTSTASSVNNLTITNSVIASPVTIGAAGSDSNIGITITPKGTGNVTLSAPTVLSNGTSASTLAFKEPSGAGTNTVSLVAPATIASSIAFTLPNAFPAANNTPILSSTTGALSFSANPIPAGTFNDMIDGRLTLTTATPVTTSDVLAATTIYYTPYQGNSISLYDGSATWNTITFTEISIAVPASTSQMYDVFIYNNSGTATLELLAWTNDTTRATALVYQNGVLVKTGATTRRYVGSCRTTTVSGQIEDSAKKRYVWNYYNRVNKPMSVIETTTSWTYSTASFRQANGSAANQLDFVIGVSESVTKANVLATVTASVAANVVSGIGLDSTTVISSLSGYITVNSGLFEANTGFYCGYPGIGRHILTWLEQGGGAGTETWYGGSNAALQSGIYGEILC